MKLFTTSAPLAKAANILAASLGIPRRFSAATILAVLVSLLAAWQSRSTDFTVSGTDNSAKTLNANSTGTVTSTGKLSVSGGTDSVTVTGNNVKINNSGQILQTGTGRGIRDNTGVQNLVISNFTGAVVQAADNDAFQMNKANGNIDLENYGSFISLNASAGGAQAIDWNAITTGANILNNYNIGLLKAIAADAVRPGVNGVVNNFGSIQAVPVTSGSSPNRDASSSDGIDGQFNTGIVINNTGSISGRHGITGGETQPNYVITVSNGVGGTITGLNGAGINIDGALTSASVVSTAFVTNRGSIIGNYDGTKYDVGDGDGVDVDGKVVLDNYGIIRGQGAAGSDSNPEGVSIGGGSIINRAGAEITGQNTSGSSAQGHGILVDNSSGGAAFAATTIDNSGLIRGYDGFGIKMVGTFDNYIANRAGGTIRGGAGVGAGAAIQTGDGNDTIDNFGAIVGDGGLAINMQGGNNTLNIKGGAASVAGNIAGGTGGVNAMNIDPGSLNTFTYAGSISQFSTVTVKSGTVSLTGANSYAGTTAVQGGKLVAGGAGALGGTSGITVSSGATLALAGTGDRINDAASLTLNSGKLDTSGLSETMGTLTTTGSSVIDMGNGNLVLKFANSSALNGTWNGTLSIYNWSGSANGGGIDQLFFGSDSSGLTLSQLPQIAFYSGNGTGFLDYARILSTGEIVPSSVPEAAMALPAAAVCGLSLVFAQRRRLKALVSRG